MRTVEEQSELINKFIPEAIRKADKAVEGITNINITKKDKNGEDYTYCLWTEAYHKAMNKLTSEEGLRIL